MDYDQTDIAASYDRARALAPETKALWQDLLSADIGRDGVSLIIDVGCGTGRFSELLAAHFRARVIGIDPSRKMIDEARAKPAYQQAPAEAIPLADRSTDLVFMSMVFHHFADRATAAKECHRVLRGGGRVCLRNGMRETDFPQRRFFPGLERLIASELPSRAEIESVFATAGFTLVLHRIVTQIVAPDWVTFAAKSALRADSFLARLPDDEFHVGIDGMRSHADKIDASKPVSEEIDWFVFAKPP